MKVHTTQPFQLIYSLFEHEYLGYLFESFVVQKNSRGELTFSHQNISSQNAREFASGLDEVDYELIALMDSMQQNAVIKKFYKKKIKPAEFFDKIYDPEKGNKLIQEEIATYLENRRAKILKRIQNKMLFEMGSDGEPAWRQIEIQQEKATILFHFRRNEDNTHYFPTIKHNGEKLDFQYKGAFLICNKPAWLVVNQKLYNFEKEPDGNKLKPFLNKKFIAIPKKIEETYFKKFVAPLVASFDVYAKGFEIETKKEKPRARINVSELISNSNAANYKLFEDNDKQEVDNLLVHLKFQYGSHAFTSAAHEAVSVNVEKQDDQFVFKRVVRDLGYEHELRNAIIERGLNIGDGKASIEKTKAFSWFSLHNEWLKENNIDLAQAEKGSNKKYFLGESNISIDIKEGIDWLDIEAKILFGQYEIPFKQIRKYILNKQSEFLLPNGQTAVIPEHWFRDYSEFFGLIEDNGSEDHLIKKHHIGLVQNLKDNDLLQSLQIDRKLEKLSDFDKIEEHQLPNKFDGELRPYQKAGFNWMKFLNEYNFGGCLADDMGLGKTVQTLAMLQAEKENGAEHASLLIMPTSLVYNWQSEARKFTPDLKIFVYTGTNRIKDWRQFEKYDLILTSYGITRIDIEILTEYYFNYVILDESQAIKNPESNIAKAVKRLKSRRRMVLTGTPVENSTLDLWSQMSFLNPGLLGNKKFFQKEFMIPIEKKADQEKSQKLATIIKPFILRRQKSQVATELPEKIENVHYSSMTDLQKDQYEEVKNYYRDKILNQIETEGIRKSQMVLLQGLTQLRQIANHPSMVKTDYEGDSGKMSDVTHMLSSAISKGHKILIFSQFVKHLNLMRKYLDNCSIQYSYLDGTTKNRQQQVECFQNNDDIKVFLISLKAGGVGLNLTAADYVFLLDPWWNPAIEQQAIDRAHRIGQKQQVFTYKFITKDTVEEKILKLQAKKIKLAQDIISTEESFIKSLSKEDIQSILE